MERLIICSVACPEIDRVTTLSTRAPGRLRKSKSAASPDEAVVPQQNAVTG